MKDNREEVLAGALSEVMEKLAFMFGEEASPDELPASESGYMKASMRFSGPFNGTLTMVVAREMCPEIAANILGVEPYDERVMEKAQDALKEVLNVTCGHVLTSLAGETPIFDLTVPLTSEIGTEEWHGMVNAPDTAIMLVDDYPVLLHLDTEGEEE